MMCKEEKVEGRREREKVGQMFKKEEGEKRKREGRRKV